MKALVLVGGALALDAVLGDPDWPGHPVRLMGRFAQAVEARLRPGARRPFAAGVLGWVLVVGLSAAMAAGLLLAAGALGSWLAQAIAAGALPPKGQKAGHGAWHWLAALLGLPAKPAAAAGPGAAFGRDLASIVLVYIAIAPRDLARHALAVAKALRTGGPEAGRTAVGRIVGRDTERLDGEGVVKACVESVAESAVDGVAAPLFWALVLGPIGAIAYRAVNTLDSMWGHKDQWYRLYGKFAARADDVANWLPARLAFLAAWPAAAVAGLDARKALVLGWRDRRKHESPNAAWLEASFAGALGLSLGGPAWYSGSLVDKPRLGEARRAPEVADIARAVVLMYLTTVIFAAALAALRSLLPGA